MKQTIRRRDTRAITWKVVDGDGNPFDIAGSTARVILKARGEAAIVNVGFISGNEIQYRPDGLLPANEYALEVELTLIDGQIVTIPTPGTALIRVLGDLA